MVCCIIMQVHIVQASGTLKKLLCCWFYWRLFERELWKLGVGFLESQAMLSYYYPMHSKNVLAIVKETLSSK